MADGEAGGDFGAKPEMDLAVRGVADVMVDSFTPPLLGLLASITAQPVCEVRPR